MQSQPQNILLPLILKKRIPTIQHQTLQKSKVHFDNIRIDFYLLRIIIMVEKLANRWQVVPKPWIQLYRSMINKLNKSLAQYSKYVKVFVDVFFVDDCHYDI